MISSFLSFASIDFRFFFILFSSSFVYFDIFAISLIFFIFDIFIFRHFFIFLCAFDYFHFRFSSFDEAMIFSIFAISVHFDFFRPLSIIFAPYFHYYFRRRAVSAADFLLMSFRFRCAFTFFFSFALRCMIFFMLLYYDAADAMIRVYAFRCFLSSLSVSLRRHALIISFSIIFHFDYFIFFSFFFLRFFTHFSSFFFFISPLCAIFSAFSPCFARCHFSRSFSFRRYFLRDFFQLSSLSFSLIFIALFSDERYAFSS